MLISMPTGTSTIFGAFQAILALLANGTNFPPSLPKLPRKPKFASEIFCDKPVRVCFATQKRPTAPAWSGDQSRVGSMASLDFPWLSDRVRRLGGCNN
jgi:hypothetical protein